MNAPSSRRVKLQKFRTLYSPHDERGSDLFIYTTKKPVAYKRTSPPSLSPSEPPAYFHRRAPTISFSLFSFRSSTLVPMHLHARAIQPSPIYGILKVNRSMHACSPIFLALKKKKKFPWNFTSLTTLPNLCNSISYQFFSIGHWSIATARGIWLLASWTPLCMPCAPCSFFFPSKNIFSRVNNKGAIIHP